MNRGFKTEFKRNNLGEGTRAVQTIIDMVEDLFQFSFCTFLCTPLPPPFFAFGPSSHLPHLEIYLLDTRTLITSRTQDFVTAQNSFLTPRLRILHNRSRSRQCVGPTIDNIMNQPKFVQRLEIELQNIFKGSQMMNIELIMRSQYRCR